VILWRFGSLKHSLVLPSLSIVAHPNVHWSIICAFCFLSMAYDSIMETRNWALNLLVFEHTFSFVFNVLILEGFLTFIPPSRLPSESRRSQSLVVDIGILYFSVWKGWVLCSWCVSQRDSFVVSGTIFCSLLLYGFSRIVAGYRPRPRPPPTLQRSTSSLIRLYGEVLSK